MTKFCSALYLENLLTNIFAKLNLRGGVSCMPAALLLISGFFCLLHSWFNAFAEMLRFADRMFYKVRFEQRHEKTNMLHMRKQRHADQLCSNYEADQWFCFALQG